MKKGDKYIHFTKYGSVNKGIIDSVSNRTHIDISNGVVYKKPYMRNTVGVAYELDGTDGLFYIIDREFDDKMKEKYRETLKRLKFKKLADQEFLNTNFPFPTNFKSEDL